MRRLAAVLTLVLLTTLLAVVGTTHVDAARPRPKKATGVVLRLAPDRITLYPGDDPMVEPTGLVAQVTPAKSGRVLTFQQRVGSSWRTLAKGRTDATGRAFLALPTPAAPGTWTYRVAVGGTPYFKPAVSRTASLAANSNDASVDGRGCRPAYAPVDPAATGEVHCLLQRLDTWKADGLMAVGQQVNTSSKDAWAAPLTGIRPAVVGFDLQELSVGDKPADQGPYVTDNIRGLLEKAHAGAVLVASWHATNPYTGQGYNSARVGLGPLVTRAGDDRPADQAAYDAFWADWDAKLALLKRFEIGDGDSAYRTPVVVRPLHEVNGAFFWWGQPEPSTYRALYRKLQDEAAGQGVHNIVWAYSGNRRTTSTKDPAAYVPSRVDVGGLDTYDPETGRGNATDVLGLEGYAAVDRVAGVDRMALTEVGPHTSTDGDWNPKVISTTLHDAKVLPLWAMLWFDDAGYAQAGKKQITSLRGGKAWLASCPHALCYLR